MPSFGKPPQVSNNVFIDAHELPGGTEIETDLCIVGAGAAGMVLAREFMNSGVRVAVMESGGIHFDPETQALYQGGLSGLRYGALDVERLRYFGGSTNHWAGFCTPFFAVDFEKREGLPYSGWPITLKELEPYYLRAAAFTQSGSFNYDPYYWVPRSEALVTPFTGNAIVPQVFKHGYLSGVTYLDEFERSKDVPIYLYANVLEIVTEKTATTVTHLRMSTLEGPEFKVTAKFYVLATGGIENPRILLLSNRVEKAGLGNGNGLVGRFFMDHIRVTGSKLIATDPDFVAKYKYTPVELDGSEIILGASVVEDIRRREGLPRCFFQFGQELPRRLPGYLSYRHLRENFGEAAMFDDFSYHLSNIIADFDTVSVMAYHKMMGKPLVSKPGDISDEIEVSTDAETTPNPDSRVTLSDERDHFGQNKVHLHWAVNDYDMVSIRRSLQILAQEMGRLGHGRIKVAVEAEGPWDSHIADNHHHHIGTTRMHDDPKQGVVDANCRVHGISNLFIAGSSVYPTAGSGTVTMLLVALAMRLSDYLKGYFE